MVTRVLSGDREAANVGSTSVFGKISRSRSAWTKSDGSAMRTTFRTRSAFELADANVDSHGRGVRVRGKPSAGWFVRSGRSLRSEPYSRGEGSSACDTWFGFAIVR